MSRSLKNEWDNILLQEKNSPYVFRTRLERIINKTLKYAETTENEDLAIRCSRIVEKLKYISDQSNQTSEGCLNSFIVLKEDVLDIRKIVNV